MCIGLPVLTAMPQTGVQHQFCRVAQGRFERFIVALTLRRDQRDGRFRRGIGEPDLQALRKEPRLVGGGRVPEHAKRAPLSIGQNLRGYLARAQKGERIRVTSRGRIIGT